MIYKILEYSHLSCCLFFIITHCGAYLYRRGNFQSHKPADISHRILEKMKFPEPWTGNCADLLRAFNKEGVEYLLIGSMAEFHYLSLAMTGPLILSLRRPATKSTDFHIGVVFFGSH